MHLNELYFNKNIKTPKTFVNKYESDLVFYTFIRCWGLPIDPTSLSEDIFNEFQLLQEDTEATTPFAYENNLSLEENALKSSLKILNAKIFSDYNQKEIQFGIEVTSLCLKNNYLFWASLGQPHLLLHRASIGLIQLHSQNDLSFDYSNSSQDPLPKAVLGLYNTANIIVNKVQLQDADKLYLISRPYVSSNIFKLDLEDTTLEKVAKSLSQDNNQLSFWVGELS
ncbi:MAG: hypothetical protein HAW63_04195 [Bdellovibrionaceae bacterium]|nr:hypothetical protein [Pseudobdellovibrionaceae bacterium]